MQAFGAMWLDPTRPLFGRASLSVELLYMNDGQAGIDQLADRVDGLSQAGVNILIRVDVDRDLPIPKTNDFDGKFRFSRFVRQIVEHPVLGRASGIIVGNEPNLGYAANDGNSFPVDWYMKVHSGVFADPSDDADVYTQVRAAGWQGDVLIAAVAPWSDSGDGLLTFYPTPHGALGTMHWHRYHGSLYWLAFNSSRMQREDVKGALHVYSNVLLCQARGLDPTIEPSFVDELRLKDFQNCQYGIRVYEEFCQQMSAQADGAGVPHYVTEWNTFVGAKSMQLDDPAWPCNNYPQGLLQNAVTYMARQPDLLGFAVFVDRDPEGGSPFWRACAAKGFLLPVAMSDAQREHLQAWDSDMNDVFESGLALATIATPV